MSIALAQNTGECSFHRTRTIWVSCTVLFASDSLFADSIRSWEITRLAGVLLKEWRVTSSICTGNVLWNDSGARNNSHFKIYLSCMTQTTAPLFRRPCDRDIMCGWKINWCKNTTNKGWQNHQWHHMFIYLPLALTLNVSFPENIIIIAVCATWETLRWNEHTVLHRVWPFLPDSCISLLTRCVRNHFSVSPFGRSVSCTNREHGLTVVTKQTYRKGKEASSSSVLQVGAEGGAYERHLSGTERSAHLTSSGRARLVLAYGT